MILHTLTSLPPRKPAGCKIRSEMWIKGPSFHFSFIVTHELRIHPLHTAVVDVIPALIGWRTDEGRVVSTGGDPSVHHDCVQRVAAAALKPWNLTLWNVQSPEGGGKSYLSEAGREGFFNNLGEVKGFRERDQAVQFSGSVEVTSEPFEADAQNLRQGEKFDSLERIFFLNSRGSVLKYHHSEKFYPFGRSLRSTFRTKAAVFAQ